MDEFERRLGQQMQDFLQLMAAISNMLKGRRQQQEEITRRLADRDDPPGSAPSGATPSPMPSPPLSTGLAPSSLVARRPEVVAAGATLLFGGCLLAGMFLFLAARHFIGGRPFAITPRGPVSDLVAPVAAAQLPLADPDPAACDVHFIHPASGEQIPIDDALNIEWSAVPAAGSYDLEMQPPPGAGSPWTLQMQTTSKRLYMDNFPAGGKYNLLVTARAGDGNALCSARFTFDKAAYIAAPQSGVSSRTNNGFGAAQNQSGPVPPNSGDISTPTFTPGPPDPADDTVDYGSCAGCSDGGIIVK
jgi:hypothetical protein